MKKTPTNIARLWFGEDTPLRRYRIQMNPDLWAACQRASLDFVAPSGAATLDKYLTSDRAAFVRRVQARLQEEELVAEAAI